MRYRFACFPLLYQLTDDTIITPTTTTLSIQFIQYNFDLWLSSVFFLFLQCRLVLVCFLNGCSLRFYMCGSHVHDQCNTQLSLILFILLYIYVYIMYWTYIVYQTVNERKVHTYTHTRHVHRRVKLAMRVLIHHFGLSFSFELATNASGLRDHILISVKFIYSNFFYKKISLY